MSLSLGGFGQQEQPFIVSGPEGAGKNLLIRHAIQRLQNESDASLNVAVLNCNAQTSSKESVALSRNSCVKHSEGTLFEVSWKGNQKEHHFGVLLRDKPKSGGTQTVCCLVCLRHPKAQLSGRASEASPVL